MRDAQPSIEREAMRDTRMAAVEAGIEVAATAWSSSTGLCRAVMYGVSHRTYVRIVLA